MSLGFLCVVLTLAPTLSDVAFAPAAGLKVIKELRTRAELELESWTCEFRGTPVPEEYLPKLEIDTRTTLRVAITDEHVATAEGAPLALRRTFDAIEGTQSVTVGMNGQVVDEQAQTAQSAVAGATVLFDERATDPARRRVLERGSCPEETLRALEIDVDFAAFVAGAGEQPWTVDARELAPLDWGLSSLEVRWTPEHEDDMPYEQLDENLTGEWTVARGGERELDGATLVVLELRCVATTHATRRIELKEVPITQGDADETTEMRMESRGEILWDPRAKIARSARIESQYTCVITATKIVTGDDDPSYSHKMSFRGSDAFEFDARIAD